MKPKIDLNSKITKLALAIHTKEVKKALEIKQSVEKSIIPIYSFPKIKAHSIKKAKPEQIGTGVLVKIKTEYFIFSATHVFCEFEGKSILVGTLEYSPIEELIGERLSTGSLKNKIDKLDATVFHIQSVMSDSLKNTAITLDDMDLDGYDNLRPVFMITGFLAKESNTSGNEIKSKAKNFPTVEIDNYNEYGYDPKSQIVLAYENQILVDNKWTTSPKPKGMSGGAIIKAQGTSISFIQKQKPVEKQLLSAITIEQHRDKLNKPGILIGTRIIVHLGLINKFMPELLKDIFEKQNE